MEKETEQSHLQWIGDSVKEDCKIVTYKRLSAAVEVDVNSAKQLLHTYVRKNQHCVSSAYVLAGELCDGGYSVTLVNSSKLDEARSFFREITSEHAYGVCKTLEDDQSLYAADITVTEPICLIQCQKSILRTIKNEKILPLDSKNPGSNSAHNKASSKFIKEVETKQQEQAKASSKFIKVENKQQEQPKVNNPGAGSSKLISKNESKHGKPAITNFFGNNAGTTKKSEKIVKIKETHEAPKQQPNKGNDSGTKNRKIETGKKLQKKETPSELKKRKRIKVFSDSEDSEEDNIEPSPSPMEADTSPTTEKPSNESSKMNDGDVTDATISTINNRKKRKVVDKMVMNKDGYIETKKEIIFETDSEEEQPTIKQSDPNPPSPVKTTTTTTRTGGKPNPKKQASLLSFFRKK